MVDQSDMGSASSRQESGPISNPRLDISLSELLAAPVQRVRLSQSRYHSLATYIYYKVPTPRHNSSRHILVTLLRATC